jgi:hypothetical protein
VQRSASLNSEPEVHLGVLNTLLGRISQDDNYRRLLAATRIGLQIPKSEVIRLLSKHLPGGKIEAQSLWRTWKRDLRQAVLLGSPDSSGRTQFLVRCDPYDEVLAVTPIPEWSKIKEAERVAALQLSRHLHQLILELSQHASVELVHNILTSRNMPWIRGFQLSPTESRDGGRDFWAYLKIDRTGSIDYSGRGREVKAYGQLKHYTKKAGSPDIDKFAGSLSRLPDREKLGLFVSTRGYSDDAMIAIKQAPLRIIPEDAWWLVELMLKYGVGLQRIVIRATELDEIFWKELSVQ